MTLFSIVAAPIYIPTNGVGGFSFLNTLSSFDIEFINVYKFIYIYKFLVLAILIDMRRFLIAFLIFISLPISDVELFLCVFWPSVCLPCRNLFRPSARFLIGLFLFLFDMELYELFVIFYINYFQNILISLVKTSLVTGLMVHPAFSQLNSE